MGGNCEAGASQGHLGDNPEADASQGHVGVSGDATGQAGEGQGVSPAPPTVIAAARSTIEIQRTRVRRSEQWATEWLLGPDGKELRQPSIVPILDGVPFGGSQNASGPNVATATSSSWSTIGDSGNPYYWVDPPASDEPVASVARHPSDDDDEVEREDPELEEDAIPPDRVAAMSIATPGWILSILRKAVRSKRPFPEELIMAHDINADFRPILYDHRWMRVLQDTMLYGYEAVYDGRKPTRNGGIDSRCRNRLGCRNRPHLIMTVNSHVVLPRICMKYQNTMIVCAVL
eukprot:COSAG05_NODE_374_length_10669_cov_71.040587_10_plen_289_part_00